jgi:uncharacterized membrane protein
MYELIVVGFKQDMYRASAVLNKLIALDDAWTVDLRDGVAVYRDYDNRLRIDQSYQLTTGEGAVWGGLWGALVGALLAAPFTAGASAAAAGGMVAAGLVGGGALGAAGGALDANWWKSEIGISDEFVYEAGRLIEPGDSAIFALLRTADPEYVDAQFRGYGGIVMRSSLTQEQSDKVQELLHSNLQSSVPA